MNKRTSSRLSLFVFLIQIMAYSLSTTVTANEKVIERVDWQKQFSKFEAEGTMVVLDEREKISKKYVFNLQRAQKRYSPASTYKIPHSLFALDAGIVKDKFQTFKWDGIKRNYKPHNQDQTLQSAMRYSAIWVYDLFAKKLGAEKSNNYLSKINYGNKDSSTKTGSYWVDGNLSISAHEQIVFLKKLYNNKLPFKIEHQLLVKDIMLTDSGENWSLHAKTGWQGHYGWWVGWVECPTGPVFFALNIDTPNRLKDLYKRKPIVTEILQLMEALPNKKLN